MAKLPKKVKTEKFEKANTAPDGKYRFKISKAEVKSSQKNEDNQYLALNLKAIEGERKGFGVFENYNLWNDNETAQKMAEVSFKNLILAIFGCDMEISNTDELTGKTFYAEIGTKEDQFGPKNYIKKYVTEETKEKKKKGEKEVPNDWNDEEEETENKNNKKKDKKKKKK